MVDRKIDKNNSRKILRDVVPSSKRSIRNISISNRDEKESGRIEHDEIIKKLIRKKELRDKRVHEDTEEMYIKDDTEVNVPRKTKSKKLLSNTLITFFIILVSVAIIAVALSLLYSKAVVTITPKIESFDVGGEITAKKNPSLKELRYEIITATSTQEKEVIATKGPLIQNKAKGVVTLYNLNSTTAQKIIAGTRLTNVNGLVYRTSNTVVIPGFKQNGSNKIPGTISVQVMADKAGSEYNTSGGIGDTLKILAYKGSSKYDTVYGKIKTDFVDGYLGNKLIISPKDEKEAVDSLKKSLKATLLEKVKETSKSNYVMYQNLYFIDFVTLPIKDNKISTSSSTKLTVPLSVQGIINYVVFDSDQLFKFIAQDQIERFPSTTYKIKGIEDMKLTIGNPKDFSPKKANTLILKVSGKIEMTGTFSEDSLKSDLAGKKLKESNGIFAKYPAISNAYALITPFWMRSFPNDEEKIILNIKSDK